MAVTALRNKISESIPLLTIDEAVIRKTAKSRFQGTSLPAIVFRQAAFEAWVRLCKGINFRSNNNSNAVRAYDSMSSKEFEGINARQQWANWRTIPRNLSGNVPLRPVYALDLCCGVGHSTEVLAHYLPEGSSILGLEYSATFVDQARKRTFHHATGARADVRFVPQSVLETFREVDGVAVSSDAVDVVNCSGAVGCHFDLEATLRLGAEVHRVLREGGIALIDSGPAGTSPVDLVKTFESLGLVQIGSARSCFADHFTQVVFRKPTSV